MPRYIDPTSNLARKVDESFSRVFFSEIANFRVFFCWRKTNLHFWFPWNQKWSQSEEETLSAALVKACDKNLVGGCKNNELKIQTYLFATLFFKSSSNVPHGNEGWKRLRLLRALASLPPYCYGEHWARNEDYKIMLQNGGLWFLIDEWIWKSQRKEIHSRIEKKFIAPLIWLSLWKLSKISNCQLLRRKQIEWSY